MRTWVALIALAITVIVCVSLVLGQSQCIEDVPGCVNKAGSWRL